MTIYIFPRRIYLLNSYTEIKVQVLCGSVLVDPVLKPAHVLLGDGPFAAAYGVVEVLSCDGKLQVLGGQSAQLVHAFDSEQPPQRRHCCLATHVRDVAAREAAEPRSHSNLVHVRGQAHATQLHTQQLSARLRVRQRNVDAPFEPPYIKFNSSSAHLLRDSPKVPDLTYRRQVV